jgi:hypothetical protein
MTNSKEYNAKYYLENKERILNRINEREKCICCQTYISKGNMKQHIETKKHIRNSSPEYREKKVQQLKEELNKIELVIGSIVYADSV